MIRLRFESLDEDAEEHEFPDIEQAIKWAIAWFVEGYHGMWEHNPDHKSPGGDEMLREYSEQIACDLRAGNKFYCGNFYETITFI